MAAADVQQPPADVAAPAIPDYLASPNAVFDDEGVQWRYGRAPDYSKTRKVWEEGRRMNHEAGSLPQLVENLVKNWEVEASFKSRLSDWRTIDHQNYTFAINGGPPQSAEHMLKVGTYNAIIAPNEYYSPENSDFASSHKTFKRMMPTFAWEVLEVYSGPPKVAFKWRHWGVMKNDYVGFNDKGDKVTAKAHGGPIDIEGVTVASVDDAVRLQSVETWFDPLEMFRQIAPGGIVNREIMDRKVEKVNALDQVKPNMDGIKIAQAYNDPTPEHSKDAALEHALPKHVSNSNGEAADVYTPHEGAEARESGEADIFHETSTTLDPAQQITEYAAQQGGDTKISKPDTNFEEKLSDTSSDSDKSWDKVEEESSASPEPESIDTSSSDSERTAAATEFDAAPNTITLSKSMYTSTVTDEKEPILDAAPGPGIVDKQHTHDTFDAVDEHLESSSGEVHPSPRTAEDAVKPAPGEAVIATADSEETRMTHEEMSALGNASGCPFLMNRE